MKHKLARDKKCRINFCKNEANRNFFLAFGHSEFLKSSRRFFFFKYTHNKFYSVLPGRIRNYSFINKQPRSVNRTSKLSRIDFRQIASFGMLSGFRKSSWLFFY